LESPIAIVISASFIELEGRKANSNFKNEKIKIIKKV